MPATLRTVELRAVGWSQAASQGLPYLGGSLSIARFLDFFLHAGTFSRVVWLELVAKQTPSSVVTALPDAVRTKPDLQRACMKGWQALFVMNQGASRIVDFLEIQGYRVAGHTDDPLHFNPIIRSIELKPSQSAVLFAHDGDPVYVMDVGNL